MERKCFPACFVQLPARTEHRRAAFYLAAEEYVARNLPEDDYVFTWQLAPTVVMGRNQVAHQEVNLDFCEQHGIDVIRRKSGGGAIFADEGNIMISLITCAGEVPPLFLEYAQVEVEGLRRLGADAILSGRNDVILAKKGKICGNAFYHMTDRNIVHGTMLYDTDADLMQGALTPDASKLKAKGVVSVRSRVGLLKDCLSLSVSELREELRRMLTNRSVELTDEDVSRIEVIEQGYYEPAFLYGSAAKGDQVFRGRIEGCGTLEFRLRLRGSLIQTVELTGDYFETEEAQPLLQQALYGVRFTRENVRQALENTHPERAIRNLSLADILKILFENN